MSQMSQSVSPQMSQFKGEASSTEALQTTQPKWELSSIEALFALPFMDLLFQAQQIHRQNFHPNKIQGSTLLNIKTGACPEDCAYCSQSGHYKTGIKKEALWQLGDVLEKAKQAKEQGATRFCMGAGWRTPPAKQFPQVLEMVKAVKAMGMETCVTLGMLDQGQAQELKAAGLDYYNHNLDTSPEYYDKIITTRCYQDRLDTLSNVQQAGMKVCCGGILGLGESRTDRASMLQQLANLSPAPESVPLNNLKAMPGTPLAGQEKIDNLEFIRTVSVARIVMPKSVVRLSAGRDDMNDEMQALCFLAGANSIFLGDKLLTTTNPDMCSDSSLLDRLGIDILAPAEPLWLGQMSPMSPMSQVDQMEPSEQAELVGL